MIAIAFVACGDEGGREPGTELGACLQGEFCESPLQCADGICVSPDQIDDGSGGNDPMPGDDGESMPGDDDGMPNDDGSSSGNTSGNDGDGTPTDGGGATVYCTEGDPNGCLCGHTADYGPPGQSCSESQFGTTALCCASEGWPGYGSCSCWALSCRILSVDTCYCGIGLPDPEDEAVSSCSAPSKGICCSDGNTCACHQDLTQCVFEGEVPVSSCSFETLDCGENSRVSACN